MKKTILILTILINIASIACAVHSPTKKGMTATIICDFNRWSNAEGWHLVSPEFVLTFIIDEDTDKAYMVGNNGSNAVVPIYGNSAITFLEVTDTKNVMTTTVAIPKTGKIKAVHSRNTVVREDILPSQYYGTCIFK